MAPQSTSFWIEDGPRFAPLIREIIGDLARRYPIDRERIYVAGCSNGGYMTMEMTSVYRDLFAAAVPICGVVESLEPGGPPLLTDAQLTAIDTPTWLVASRDDTTVPPEPNTIHAHDLIPGSLMTLYDHVIWNGYQFNGHWSWIYVARNDPSHQRNPHLAVDGRPTGRQSRIRSRRPRSQRPSHCQVAPYSLVTAAIWMRLPQVSSRTAVVTGPIVSGAWVNRTPSAESRSYSAGRPRPRTT